MKKLIAILLAAMFLFASACTSGNSPETATDAQKNDNQSVSSQGLILNTTQAAVISDWNIPELPEGFPAPPDGISGYSHNTTKGENGLFPKNVEVIEINFTCQKHNFITFTNSLLDAGYKGGFVHITDGTEYYRNGYIGGWQNGETAVLIFNTIEIDKNLSTYYITVSECSQYFPSGLDGIIPRFDGYSIHTGTYNFVNSKGEFEYAELPKDLGNAQWTITHAYGDYNSFLGVTTTEFNDYCDELGKAGFTCELSHDNYDGANVLFLDGTKVIDGKTYTVQLLYNSSAQMMDAMFANC